MKAVCYYRVEIEVYGHFEKSPAVRYVSFSDRRKALSYYEKSLDYWNPEQGHLYDKVFIQVDICLIAEHYDDSRETLFSETITY